MRTAIRAMLTLLLAATALTATPVAAQAAPDGAAPGFTMAANAKPAVDMSAAMTVRFTNAGVVSCQVLAPVPPYFVDMLCYVYSGVVSILVFCSDGSGLISNPMVASPYPYYGRATCGPPAYVVGMNSI